MPNVLEDWLEIMRNLLPKLIDQFVTWNGKGLKIGTVLVYLNHLTYHLVETKMTVLENFKFLAVAMFYLLCTYVQSGGAADKSDLVPDVAHKTYSLVCAAGQRVQKSLVVTHPIIQRCYELYFLGAACLNLDHTNSNRNGMKTATDFIVAYVDWFSRLKDSGQDDGVVLDANFNADLLSVAVKAYTAQPRDLYGDASLAFFMELFRLSEWQPVMAGKLFACDANLFEYETDNPLLQFSDAPSQSVIAINYKESVKIPTLSNNEVKDLVMDLLRLSQTFVSSDLKDKTSAAALEKSLENHSHFHNTIHKIFTYLANSPKPVQPAVAKAVLMAVKVLPQTDDTRGLLGPKTLRLCYRLTSLAVRIAVRELLKVVGGRPEQEVKVQSKIYELALMCKARLAFLQQFVAKVHSDIEEMRDIAIYLKPCLTALTHMISQVDKKNLIDQQSAHYRQVYKCVECAVFNIGSIGRNLRRFEEFEIAVALLSQLWPVADIPALRTVKDLLSGHQTATINAHSEKLLKKLRTSEHVPPQKRAVYTLLLAEVVWTSGDSTASLTLERCNGLAFNMACEALKDLAAYECHDLDDYLSQATFLVWEIRNRAACLKNIAKMKPIWERKFRNRPQAATSTPSEPAEPAAHHQRSRKACVQADTAFNPISGVEEGVSGAKKNAGVDRLVEGQSSEAKTLADPNIFQTDSDVLMYKARDCLAVWISWFKGHCENKGGLDSLRVERSLRFLTRIADLALLCHQLKPAVESLCQARTLALLYNKGDTAKRVIGTLVYSLVQLGYPICVPPLPPDRQQTTPSSRPESPESCRKSDDGGGGVRDKASHADDDDDDTAKKEQGSEGKESFASQNTSGTLSVEDLWFLEQLGLGADCHVLQLASVAFHYLRTGQALKFLNLRTCILARIEAMRAIGPLTPNCTLTLCIIHRLTAEFYQSPASQKYRNQGVVRKGENDYELEPYPVESISDSLKYIVTVAAFYMGDNFKDQNRGVCTESWRLLNEYLTTLKLQGELYIQSGNLKYARTHFCEGLKAAMSSLLSTW
ncbi:hypothetical protein ElyMa_000690500 [Elysia marginata]|uniref:Separase n=1 Tax=Elysia marginata TaxID=1093978 RepID=A0AAV4GHL8_9GAST|nr:hypothetical protein ElyMa_000690500 [Elysia marginata]